MPLIFYNFSKIFVKQKRGATQTERENRETIVASLERKHKYGW